jgi:hypothetical protein
MCLVRNRPIPIAPSPKIRRVIISAVSIVQIYNINLTLPNGGVTFLLVWCSVVSSKRYTHYGIPQYQLVVTR